MYPRVLIVGTVPYNKKSTSRAFDAYFNNWDKENLAQIFSNTKKPVKGHCKTLFQITDQRLIQCRYNKRMRSGKIFQYEELAEEWSDNSLEINSKAFNWMYRIGHRKTPIKYLIRKLVWRKKFWCTEELNKWLDDFAPQCVFLSFSDDFFIPQIALYVAEKYNIPIVSSIGDDYYFNHHFTISPLYYLYRGLYKKLIKNIFMHGGSAIYISDKIRDKYNTEFGLKGKTVYLSSEIKRKAFREIDSCNPIFSYFGNIRQGRNESLNEIGNALGKISKDYYLNIYSNQDTPNAISVFKNNPNIIFHGSVSYRDVLEKTKKSDVVVIVEGFKKKHVNNTRYSLSTKAADSLASGAQILVYGSSECGVIEYMQSTKSAFVCTKANELEECIRSMIDDKILQKRNYENAIAITEKHHNLRKSTSIFLDVVMEAIREYGEKE